METPERLKLGFFLFAGSLFCQWVIWFACDKLSLSFYLIAGLPLILCLLYHALQFDSGPGKLMPRAMVFRGTVLYPLTACAVLAAVLYWNFPALPVFGGQDAAHAAQNILAKYAARMMATSLYLLVFALFDWIYFLFTKEKQKKQIKNPE